MNTRLKELRKALGLTLEKFSRAASVSASAVNAWELGQRNIPESKVRLICAEFNVNREWLETGEGEMFVEGKTNEALDYEAFGRVAYKLFAALPRELRAVVVDVARDIAGVPTTAVSERKKDRRELEKILDIEKRKPR